MFKKMKQSIQDKEQASIHNYGLSKQTASNSRRISISSQKSLQALGSDKESYKLVRHSYQHLPTAVNSSQSNDIQQNDKYNTHNPQTHSEEDSKNNLMKIESNCHTDKDSHISNITIPHLSTVSPVNENTDILKTIESHVSQSYPHRPTIYVDDVDFRPVSNDDENEKENLISKHDNELLKKYETKIKRIEEELIEKNQVIGELHSTIKKKIEENMKYDLDLKQLLSEKTELEKTVELNHGEINQLHSQLLNAQSSNNACHNDLRKKDGEIECLKNENSELLSQIKELKSNLSSKSEQNDLISSRHEEEMKEKNIAIKKMEQKLFDMRKLFHQELNVLNKQSNKNDTPTSIVTSNSYTNVPLHAWGSNITNNTTECNNEPDTETKSKKNDKALSSSSNNINSDSDNDRVVFVVSHIEDTATNKTVDGEKHKENGDYSRNETRQKRLSSATIEASTALFVNQHPDNVNRNGLDNLNDTNFKYLKHVLMKFLLCREHEAMQLMRVVSVLLKFSREEENLLRDTLLWKTSWFGSRPPLPPSMHL